MRLNVRPVNSGVMPLTTNNVPSNAIPRQIEGLSDIVAVAAGFRHSLALTASGQVYSWGGKITEGKNGPEAIKNKELILIGGLPKISKIYAGRDYSLAVSEDGKLFGWGANNSHQLSPDKTTFFAQPVQIMLPGSVVDVAAGQGFVLAAISK